MRSRLTQFALMATGVLLALCSTSSPVAAIAAPEVDASSFSAGLGIRRRRPYNSVGGGGVKRMNQGETLDAFTTQTVRISDRGPSTRAVRHEFIRIRTPGGTRSRRQFFFSRAWAACAGVLIIRSRRRR